MEFLQVPEKPYEEVMFGWHSFQSSGHQSMVNLDWLLPGGLKYMPFRLKTTRLLRLRNSWAKSAKNT